MTTGESSTPDFSFDAIINGSGIVDPGMIEHLKTIAAYERSLNGQGGKESSSYDSILRSINEEWPQHDIQAEISGRLYVYGNIIDADALERATIQWGDPIRAGDTMYWDVVGAELVSRGVVDDNDDLDAKLVCAYSFEGDPVPSFTTRPAEFTVTYQRLTREGGEHYLRREWSNIVEFVEAILPEGVNEVSDVPHLIRAIVDEYQDELYAHDELCFALSEFVTYRLAFNQTAAYVLVVNGPIDFHDVDGEVHKLNVKGDRQEFIYRPTVVFSNRYDVASGKLVVSTGDGSDDEQVLIAPLDSVSDLRATFSGRSLLEASTTVDVDDNIDDSEVEYVVEGRSSREANLDALRALQTIINEAIYQARRVNDVRCSSVEEAKEIAESIIGTIQQNLEDSDIDRYRLTIEGQGIGVPSSKYKIDGALSSGLGIVSLDEPGFMEIGDRRHGYYSDVYGSYALYDENEDEEEVEVEVAKPVICMQVQIGTLNEVSTWINDVPTNEVIIRSFATVPLDGSVTIVVERLDIEERINASILQLSEGGSNEIVDQFENVYKEAMTVSGMPVEPNGIEALHSMSVFCSEQANDVQRKTLIEALSGTFNDMTVALNTTQDQTELMQGTIVDVKFESSPDFPPTGLIFAFAADNGSNHLIAVDSLQTLIVGGHA